MTELPKRPTRHAVGERGIAILKLALPSQWILRNQVESDYGIDVEIEIARENVTGILLKAQVRTKTPITWRNDGTFREPFSPGKLKYWRTIGLPVVLFLVDNKSEDVYWAVASGEKPADSSLPNEIIVKKSDSLQQSCNDLISYVLSFTSHFDAKRLLYRIPFFLELYERRKESIGYDCFLPLEPNDYASLYFLYEETMALRNALGLKTEAIVPWPIWLIRSNSIFGDSGELHNGVHDEMMGYLEPLVAEAVKEAKTIIEKEEITLRNIAAKTALAEPSMSYGISINQKLPKEFWNAFEMDLDRRKAKKYSLAEQE